MTQAKGNDRKPVVMQVVPALETGGVERGTVDVAMALMAAGYQAVVASAGGQMERELTRCGAIHETLPLDSKNPFVMRRNADRLAALADAYGVDILHARSRAPAWSAYWATRRCKIPFVTTFHATYNFSNPLKKIYNSVMTKGDRVIAISDFIRRHMMEEYGTPWARIRIIHRGIDTHIFDPAAVAPSRVVQLAKDWRLPDGVPVILLSGRLTRWKGQTLLLEAIAKLEQPVRCLLVGSAQGRDDYREEVEALAARLGIDDRVHVVGDCRDMPAAYKLADVVVSASTDPEGFGRVAVEGQAMGRPVVAPNHGAAPEQIQEGVTGWLFQPGNADDFAGKIKAALSLNEEERAAFHERAIANVRAHFTRERMCADTLSLYRDLIDRRAQGL